MSIVFEWDEAKNRTNLRKHGLTFAEASEVFRDPFHFSEVERFEAGEQRRRTIGRIKRLVLVMVAHTTTDVDDTGVLFEVVRIISARPASRQERRRYEN